MTAAFFTILFVMFYVKGGIFSKSAAIVHLYYNIIKLLFMFSEQTLLNVFRIKQMYYRKIIIRGRNHFLEK